MRAPYKKTTIWLLRTGLILLSIISLSLAAGAETRRDSSQYEDWNKHRNPPKKPGQHQQYSIAQAVSDQAQLHTIAFNGLAFITGDFGASSFIPPGKVCDFFGFQYMRDIDAAEKGHNPMFLDRVAGNVLHVLNEDQRKLFRNMAAVQAKQLKSLAIRRLPLIKAFHRQLEGDIPKSSSGLNREAVMHHVGEIFAFDAELSYRRAEIMGQVAASLSPEQKSCLGRMKFGDFNTWPHLDVRQYKLPRGTEKLVNVAYMTYASEFFSWYAGSITADTYFCPERHSTYFGGFYMKDMPAMGKRDYDISTSVTGNSGRIFLERLTSEQRKHVTGIIDIQRKPLMEIIAVRRSVAGELRKFLKEERANREKVLALGRRYGELDGELSWYYAMAFAEVNRSLTNDQRHVLMKLRNLERDMRAPVYLYSHAMKNIPVLPDTDQFFFPSRRTAKQ